MNESVNLEFMSYIKVYRGQLGNKGRIVTAAIPDNMDSCPDFMRNNWCSKIGWTKISQYFKSNASNLHTSHHSCHDAKTCIPLLPQQHFHDTNNLQPWINLLVFVINEEKNTDAVLKKYLYNIRITDTVHQWWVNFFNISNKTAWCIKWFQHPRT